MPRVPRTREPPRSPTSLLERQERRARAEGRPGCPDNRDAPGSPRRAEPVQFPHFCMSRKMRTRPPPSAPDPNASCPRRRCDEWRACGDERSALLKEIDQHGTREAVLHQAPPLELQRARPVPALPAPLPGSSTSAASTRSSCRRRSRSARGSAAQRRRTSRRRATSVQGFFEAFWRLETERRPLRFEERENKESLLDLAARCSRCSTPAGAASDRRRRAGVRRAARRPRHGRGPRPLAGRQLRPAGARPRGAWSSI